MLRGDVLLDKKKYGSGRTCDTVPGHLLSPETVLHMLIADLNLSNT